MLPSNFTTLVSFLTACRVMGMKWQDFPAPTCLSVLRLSNPTETVFTEITVKSGTQVAAVDKGDALFTVFLVYTDNADSSIKVREVQYTPPS